MYYLYQIENTITGQKYYGVTSTTPDKRWSQHRRFCFTPSKKNDCPKLYNSMRKYGVENFVHTTILQSEDAKYVEDMEVKYIDEGEDLLNISPGGGGMCSGNKWKHSPETIEKLRKKPGGFTGRKHTEESKKKIRDTIINTGALTGEKNGMYGKTHTPEEIERRRKMMLERNPMKGKNHTEETRRKISEKAMGRIPWNKGLKNGKRKKNVDS